MRKIVNCPGEAAALAEVKAEAAGSSKQPQKPAETPRQFSGKRQRPSTLSTQTPTKLAQRGGGGRSKR